MHLIVIYALTLEICIYMHYKSSPNEPLCDSFAPKFSDKYTEYALYPKFKALVITTLNTAMNTICLNIT